MKILHLILGKMSRVFVIGAVVLTPCALWAQDDGLGRITYRIVDVSPADAGDLASALGEVSEAARAAGWAFYHVYSRVRGDQPGFVIIAPDELYTDLPPLNLNAGLTGRLQNNQNGNTVLSLATYPNLGISSDSAEPGGNFLRIRVRTVSPGNAQAYMDWQENQMMPAQREAGVTDLRFARVTLGGNPNTFVRFTYPNETVGGEPNLAEAVGQRGFQQILERESSLLANAEDYLYAYRRDLSFTGN